MGDIPFRTIPTTVAPPKKKLTKWDHLGAVALASLGVAGLILLWLLLGGIIFFAYGVVDRLFHWAF